MNMTNVMQTVAAMQQGGVAGGMRGILGGQNKAQGGDMFAMLLAQMLGGAQGEHANAMPGTEEWFLANQNSGMAANANGDPFFGMGGDLQALLSGGIPSGDLLALLGGIGGEEEEQDDTSLQNAMEMLSGMFVNNTSQLEAMMQNMTNVDETLAKQALQNGMDPAALMQLLNSGTSGTASSLQNALTLAQQASAQETENEESAGFETLLVQQQAAGDAKGEGQQSKGFGGQSEFLSSVAEAQKLLKAAQGKSDKEAQPLDIEQLQSTVDTARFSTAAKTQQAQLPTAQELIDQAAKGIKENVALGKNEFVVKLKPDGMGEITVKLMEKDNKISLSITTASAQTAKLLSNEVEALKLTLRPLNAEVREIVVTQPQQKGGDMGSPSQSFAEHQHQQQSQQQNHTPSTDYSSLEQETHEVSADRAAQNPAELDTYI